MAQNNACKKNTIATTVTHGLAEGRCRGGLKRVSQWEKKSEWLKSQRNAICWMVSFQFVQFVLVVEWTQNTKGTNKPVKVVSKPGG